VHSKTRRFIVAKVEVRVSDLSGEFIQDESDLAEVIVQHPDFENPIRLDALISDLQDRLPQPQDFVALTVNDQQYLMSISEFNGLFTDAQDAEDILERASKEQHPRQRRRKSQRPRVNYQSPEHAGEPHRGRITEEEKAIVRDNLEVVNERLERDGYRVIDPTDPELRERYELIPDEPAEDE
jgi:hypothetical protein